MGGFTIPSIFIAIDRLTGPLRTMGKSVEGFAQKAEGAIGRSERMFRKMTPVLSGVSKEFLSMASTAALVGSLVGGVYFSFDAIKEYETALKSLQAVTGVTDQVFAGFKVQIQAIAKETGKSAIDIAKAFEVIGSERPELLNNADALGKMTKATMVLASASRMELDEATKSLTTSLNQYGLSTDFAAKAVDMLAAGNVAGASSIVQTTEALAKFGTVAANTGTKLNESIALVELVSPFEKGAEAGVKLRNVLLNMSSAKILDKAALKDLARLHVNLDLVSNKALPLNTRLKEMSKIAGDANAIMHVFGKENASLATAVLTNAGGFEAMLNSVNQTGFAEKQAALNSDTLTKAIASVTAAYVNLLVSNENVGVGLTFLKGALKFVAQNMATIVTIGLSFVGMFVLLKGILFASKVALIAYNIVFGIYNALLKRSLFYTEGNIYAKNADLVATKAITAAQWLWNAAMAANPITWVVIGVLALVAAVVLMIKYWNQWGAVLAVFLGPLGLVISLIQSFRRNWEMIKKAFSEGGILAGLKAIGATILDAILMPLQQVLKVISNLTGFDWAADAMKSIESFRAGMGVNVTTDESGNPLTPAVNPKALEQKSMVAQMMNMNSNANVNLNVNDPTGRTTAESSDPFVKIKLGTTMPGY